MIFNLSGEVSNFFSCTPLIHNCNTVYLYVFREEFHLIEQDSSGLEEDAVLFYTFS
jgi:hypothetical protein